MTAPATADNSLSEAQARHVDRVCNAYEVAWKSAGAAPGPRLEDFLNRTDAPPESALVRELIVLEIYYRRLRGEDFGHAEYLARFPALDPAWLAEAAAPSLGSPAAVHSTVAQGRAAVPVDAAPLPQWIDRYRIERVLGEGGFGRVYLAEDAQLSRHVAIKVPRDVVVARAGAAQAYLAEARTGANLDHPNIVPIYDVGSTDECCFIVSKFIEGTTLADRIQDARMSAAETAALVATVAEALHYAHIRGIVHRDIKPSNILLDLGDKPFLTDFGLALKEDANGHGPTQAGTPAYMSPEQARGEGHRVDGRSDIFSLGAVLYELLTGKTPFRGATTATVLEHIAAAEPRPPRQIDDTIPKELERICLKALAKRASDRYTTARDMADELRQVSFPTADLDKPHSGLPVKVVPKGLRSFDASDADFFLELVPGPRGRDGLPESIRFWKARIEATHADGTFSVGVIYGPSGCGKSSLLKAGLLPRLANSVTPLYVEATASETECRLLKSLRRQVPELPANLNLIDSLATLRRGQFPDPGKKLLLVLDQFEQWLHAWRAGSIGDQTDIELVQALRQCDGARLQCIVLVRDDFWLAISRFMKALEVEILEGRNSTLVDLFDPLHARNVLAAFGRAYGRLPDNLSQCSKEQEVFLDQGVAGLAQEGKVISVGLALFAEMVKGKPWTPVTLKEVGGTEGIGITFLEETFTASTAPPQHRLHQKAAQAVLKALLPESGTDIKGTMRSRRELLEASGYASHPGDFEELLRILDSEIRLLTPTDPEGVAGGEWRAPGESSTGAAATRYYQLTHDYLVPSVKAWLTRKQKETRRGRAELLLADRAATWTTRPENRQLPSLAQWLQIRAFTLKRRWTPQQQRMMRVASRYHGLRALALVVCLGLLAWVSWEGFGSLKAQTLRDRLLESTTTDVPAIVQEMAPYRRWANRLVQEALTEAEAKGQSRKQLHASLALLPVDAGQVDYLLGRLLNGQPAEVLVIRRALTGHRTEFTERLWALAQKPLHDPEQRFRAACALAAYSPEDDRWQTVSRDVAARLVAQNLFVIGQWSDLLRPVARSLLPPLALFLEEEHRSAPERALIAKVYGTLAEDEPDSLTRLEKRLAEDFAPAVSTEVQTTDAKRQANLGIALLLLGRPGRVWPLLQQTVDPTVRALLIERLAAAGVEPGLLIAHLGYEPDASIRQALLLALGQYDLGHLPEGERLTRVPQLVLIYRDDADAGIHSAAEWLLRAWHQEKALQHMVRIVTPGKVMDGHRWYINRQGQTMTVIAGPVEFVVNDRYLRDHPAAIPPRRGIAHSYALATKEVTVDQFLRYRPDYKPDARYVSTGDSPANLVSWYDAAAYCNWLSEQEGIPKDQWCYLPTKDGRYAEGMKVAADWIHRQGYRLPTEDEWVYACRAGSSVEWAFGNAPELMEKYAWFSLNALDFKARPVGLLKPNSWGLFDMYGNLREWSEEAFQPLSTTNAETAWSAGQGALLVNNKVARLVQGGSFYDFLKKVSRAQRFTPAARHMDAGFRPARTVR
jgi:serine/threonine protein kinase/formylglycine-generating enzyme required for sulfatase activity